MRSRSDTWRGSGAPDRSQTVESKRHRGPCPKILYILGIGPGSPEHLTRRAEQVLGSVDAVCGYTTYIDLIRPLVEGKQVVETPMTREVERVQAAIDIARSGKSCAIVSGGDPGIYAMAGLVFEICSRNRIPIRLSGRGAEPGPDAGGIAVEVIPGVPALCAGASLLGAPLTHDFAVISLSDLLTPWGVIEQRLRAAAGADFVIVLYNPKSRRRSGQLEKAQAILLEYKDPQTPVGIATRAMRDGQRVSLVPLGDLHTVPADMQTTVFIGNRSSRTYQGVLFTPRGYSHKYCLHRDDTKDPNDHPSHPA